MQVTIVLSCLRPFLQLAIEEALQRAIALQVVVLSQVLPSCFYLQSSQSVFIPVVGVHLLYVKGSIAVASPSAAEIKFAIDAPYTVRAAESQSESIILPITGIGKENVAQQRSEESPWSTQSIDAQSIVGSIVISPLTMVDKSRRQGVELEVAHPVCSYHHGSLLLVEGIHNLLQSVLRGIQIVAVELHRKASAAVIHHSHVPAPPYSQVMSFGYDVHEVRVIVLT